MTQGIKRITFMDPKDGLDHIIEVGDKHPDGTEIVSIEPACDGSWYHIFGAKYVNHERKKYLHSQWNARFVKGVVYFPPE